jgi:hypothetical protein
MATCWNYPEIWIPVIFERLSMDQDCKFTTMEQIHATYTLKYNSEGQHVLCQVANVLPSIEWKPTLWALNTYII